MTRYGNIKGKIERSRQETPTSLLPVPQLEGTGQLVQFRGKHCPYLKQPEGRASHTWHACLQLQMLQSYSILSCFFGIFDPSYLNSVKLDAMSLTSGRFMLNLVCSYLPRTRETWLYYVCYPVVVLCVKRERVRKESGLKFKHEVQAGQSSV